MGLFDFTPISLPLLGLIVVIVLAYVVVTELVKLAYFKKLIMPRIFPVKSVQHRLLDVVAIICLRFESEISIESLFGDVAETIKYPLKPQQVLNHLRKLESWSLISINWREGMIIRHETMKNYVKMINENGRDE